MFQFDQASSESGGNRTRNANELHADILLRGRSSLVPFLIRKGMLNLS